jgi:hypothetical protein
MTAATIAESCSRRGQGVHRPEDVEDIQAWRAEIRRKRRPDRIKVRTDFNDGIALPCGSERTGLSRMPKCGTSATALANGSAGHPTKAQIVSCPPGRPRGDLRLWPCSALGHGSSAENVERGAPSRRRMPERGAADAHRRHDDASRVLALAPRQRRWSHRRVTFASRRCGLAISGAVGGQPAPGKRTPRPTSGEIEHGGVADR